MHFCARHKERETRSSSSVRFTNFVVTFVESSSVVCADDNPFLSSLVYGVRSGHVFRQTPQRRPVYTNKGKHLFNYGAAPACLDFSTLPAARPPTFSPSFWGRLLLHSCTTKPPALDRIKPRHMTRRRQGQYGGGSSPRPSEAVSDHAGLLLPGDIRLERR